jgi:hypothetical protein
MQQPRQMYGLGSFVKKAVKKVANVAKNVVSSDLGKTALTAAALYYGRGMLPGGGGGGISSFFGKGSFNPFLRKVAGDTAFSTLGQIGSNLGLVNSAGGLSVLGKTAAIVAPSVAGGMLTAKAQEDVEALRSSGDQGLLKAYLERYYKNLNPIGGKDPEDYEAEVQSFVRANAANGGRMGYAFGTPEQNAMKAASVEGLPLNQNPAGIRELDLRDNGGFIPPVGVKEKADDIPAMLSNNEFVFTADAVRNMGDGNVNKGAQRMYDFMKYLENGGRV